MMVVMKKDYSPQELQAVLDHLEEGGLSGHKIIGVERTVIGVVGQIYPELSDELRAFPGVDGTVPISKPYKLASRELKPDDTVVKVGNVEIGNGSTVVIAGQCSVDTPEQMMATAQAVKAAGGHLLRGGAFKPRSSPHAFRGLVDEGLRILAEAGAAYNLPTVSEVMDPRDVEIVAEHVDLLQIGTRNAQNYYLLDEVGNCNKPVLLKRGMACSVEEWLLCAEYVLARGNQQVILCERGIRTFETATRNTLDLSAVPVVQLASHLPVIVDPSHATGRPDLVLPLSLAGIAAGANGVLVEMHPNPEHALSDGQQSLSPAAFAEYAARVRDLVHWTGKTVS